MNDKTTLNENKKSLVQNIAVFFLISTENLNQKNKQRKLKASHTKNRHQFVHFIFQNKHMVHMEW
jgi:hypothetical protein